MIYSKLVTISFLFISLSLWASDNPSRDARDLDRLCGGRCPSTSDEETKSFMEVWTSIEKRREVVRPEDKRERRDGHGKDKTKR